MLFDNLTIVHNDFPPEKIVHNLLCSLYSQRRRNFPIRMYIT